MSDPSAPVPQRIGDAERDQAAALLRDHMAEGRLDQDEFDERIGKALSARTHADLLPLFDDLPGPKPGQGLAPVTPFQAPPWQQTPSSNPGREIAQPRPVANVPARSGDRSLAIVSAIVWPVTLLVLFATHWHFWWLIFIPIIVSSALGKAYSDRRNRS